RVRGLRVEPIRHARCASYRPATRGRCSAENMTLDDVVRFSGETADTIRHWQELGLVREGEDFGAEELERVGLVGFAARRGISPEDMARYCEEHGDWLEVFARWGT